MKYILFKCSESVLQSVGCVCSLTFFILKYKLLISTNDYVNGRAESMSMRWAEDSDESVPAAAKRKLKKREKLRTIREVKVPGRSIGETNQLVSEYIILVWISVNALSWGFRWICSTCCEKKREEKRSCGKSVKSKLLAAASEKQINWLPNISPFLVTLEGDGRKIWKIYPRVPHAVPIETENKVLHLSDKGERLFTFLFTFALLMFVLLSQKVDFRQMRSPNGASLIV